MNWEFLMIDRRRFGICILERFFCFGDVCLREKGWYYTGTESFMWVPVSENTETDDYFELFSPFIDAVYDSLLENGYKVEKNVGVL